MPANPRELLDKRRRETRDLETLRYVRPRGEELHVVKDSQGVERIVTATQPGTHSPGNLVLIGSESGGRAKEIIGAPQAGSRRGGAFPTNDLATDASAPVLLAAHPAEVPAGAVDFRVVFVVRNLSSNPWDIFRPVTSELDEQGVPVTDPLVTIHDLELVDAEDEALTVEIGEDCVAVLIDLDPSVAEGYAISIQPQRA